MRVRVKEKEKAIRCALLSLIVFAFASTKAQIDESSAATIMTRGREGGDDALSRVLLSLCYSKRACAAAAQQQTRSSDGGS